jgi:hypothetical protein
MAPATGLAADGPADAADVRRIAVPQKGQRASRDFT